MFFRVDLDLDREAEADEKFVKAGCYSCSVGAMFSFKIMLVLCLRNSVSLLHSSALRRVSFLNWPLLVRGLGSTVCFGVVYFNRQDAPLLFWR